MKAYAKINLTLNILNKREDNYHNLKSVMIPIDLFDELFFEHSEEYILDSNIKDNIITKVFNIFKERYNISNVKITLKKNIPSEAGLGGGSSDATTTIKALNNLFNLNLDIKEQEEIANLVGSDTLFTLHSKPAIITSRGDEIEFFNSNHNFFILLIKPNFGFSTIEAFKNIQEYNIKHNDNIINALQNNDINAINTLCYNSFLDSLLKNDEFKSLYEKFSIHGKVHLSGSGSTLYMISDDLTYLKNIKQHFTCYCEIVKTL